MFRFTCYSGDEEGELFPLMQLVDSELSEPYSIFTYRFFVQQWPQHCHLAWHGEELVGVAVGKVEPHATRPKEFRFLPLTLGEHETERPPTSPLRGYIAMLVVRKDWRGRGLGRQLVSRLIASMTMEAPAEIVLEAEESNQSALSIYASFGFVRDKRLTRYYLNGSDAFRLKLYLS